MEPVLSFLRRRLLATLSFWLVLGSSALSAARSPVTHHGERAPTTRQALALPRFHIRHLDAEIFARATRHSRVVGLVRRGSRIAVRPAPRRSGCPTGRWYPAVAGGYLCTAWGFTVGASRRASRPQPRFAAEHALPYRYVRAIHRRAPMLRRLPTAAEVQRLRRAVAGLGPWPSVALRRMDGAYFLALGREVTHLGTRYLQTVRGEYVRAADVKPFPPTRLRGEVLDAGASDLPLAIVLTQDASVFERSGKGLRWVEHLDHYARFSLARRHPGVRVAGAPYVVTRQHRLVARGDVRVARLRKRPDGVPPGARWIHFALSEQTLVAYEGDRPVYATLISSGKKPHNTPTGLYRIYAKHRSVTMRGPDPDKGWYYIEEVPWTQFYHHGFAVHGAYWHDRFGHTKSHGCTNLAPADARWLFQWTRPRLPTGWHAKMEVKGTWVYFTR